MTDEAGDGLAPVADALSSGLGDLLRGFMDGVSWLTLLGTWIGYLPEVAAFFTIVWTLIRIYETNTIQGFIQRRRNP